MACGEARVARPALTGCHRPLYQVGFAFLCIAVMISTWVFVLLLDSIGVMYVSMCACICSITIRIGYLLVYMILVIWGFGILGG